MLFMKINKHRLSAKGWSEEEIQQATNILQEAELKKHSTLFLLEKMLFWGLLILTTMGVFAISVYMIPLFFVLNNWINSLILSLLGLCLGSFLTLILKDLEWLGFKHHLFTLIVIPLIVISNFFLINNITHEISTNQIYLMSGVFSLALLLPYFLVLINDLVEEKALKENANRG